MPYGLRLKADGDNHNERPGHIILVVVTLCSVLLTICLLVLLGCYAAQTRSSEDDQFALNYTSLELDGDPTAADDDVISDADLGVISQALWDRDTSRLHPASYVVHPQAVVNMSNRVDHSPDSFLTRLDIDLYTHSATYRTFLNLLNNFKETTRLPDVMTSDKMAEINLFLDAILETQVMKAAQYFLAEKNLIAQNTSASMREKLFSVWFEPYSRSPKYNMTDSSGFEHVFVGEIRGNKAMGMHSWIQLYQQELMGNLDYMGYHHHSLHQRVFNIQFRWHEKLKKRCSLFLGTSPEFDMAVYTICLLTRIQRECHMTIGGTPIGVQTWDMRHVPGLQIGTAYVI